MKKLLFSALAVFCITTANAQIKIGGKTISKDKVDAVKGAATALTLTDADVAASAAKSVQWMDENNPVCSVTEKQKDKKAYAQRLENLVKNLKNYDGEKLNYKVYYVKDINAFAAPDGSIRVFSSLMDIMTDDELMGIIGHEIGHVKLDHSLKKLKGAMMTDAVKKYAGSTKGGGSIAAQLTNSDLGALAENFTGAQYSQEYERQADDYAYKFMIDNGRDPKALATAFRKLAELGGGGKAGVTNRMFSTHPDSEKRAQRIEDKINGVSEKGKKSKKS